MTSFPFKKLESAQKRSPGTLAFPPRRPLNIFKPLWYCLSWQKFWKRIGSFENAWKGVSVSTTPYLLKAVEYSSWIDVHGSLSKKINGLINGFLWVLDTFLYVQSKLWAQAMRPQGSLTIGCLWAEVIWERMATGPMASGVSGQHRWPFSWCLGECLMDVLWNSRMFFEVLWNSTILFVFSCFFHGVHWHLWLSMKKASQGFKLGLLLPFVQVNHPHLVVNLVSLADPKYFDEIAFPQGLGEDLYSKETEGLGLREEKSQLQQFVCGVGVWKRDSAQSQKQRVKMLRNRYSPVKLWNSPITSRWKALSQARAWGHYHTKQEVRGELLAAWGAAQKSTKKWESPLQMSYLCVFFTFKRSTKKAGEV